MIAQALGVASMAAALLACGQSTPPGAQAPRASAMPESAVPGLPEAAEASPVDVAAALANVPAAVLTSGTYECHVEAEAAAAAAAAAAAEASGNRCELALETLLKFRAAEFEIEGMATPTTYGFTLEGELRIGSKLSPLHSEFFRQGHGRYAASLLLPDKRIVDLSMTPIGGPIRKKQL